MPNSRLVIAFCPYPLNGTTTAPIPLTAEQCAEMNRRIEMLPDSVIGSIKNVMRSVMGKHARNTRDLLSTAVTHLMARIDRSDAQYPLIEEKVYIISASEAGGNFTTDMILALEMSGITKEPL